MITTNKGRSNKNKKTPLLYTELCQQIRGSTYILSNERVELSNMMQVYNECDDIQTQDWFCRWKTKKPLVNDLEEEDWVICNSMVMSWVINSLNKESYESVVCQHITLKMWKELKEHFSQGNKPHIQEIKREIANA